MEYLLSICIPTYNRANLLANTLTSIFNENENNSDFEIVISDNCSTDQTEFVVKKFLNINNNIKYIKQPSAIDGNSNIIFALNNGTGKFLKLCNDTALFESGSIRILLNLIKVNENTKPVIFFSNISNSVELIYEKTFNNFVRINSFLTTSILAIGFWHTDFKNFEYLEDAFEYSLPALNLIRKNFKQKNNFLIYNNKIFSVQYVENKGGYNIIDVFVINYLCIILRKEYKNKNISFWTFEFEKIKVLTGFVAPWMKLLKKTNSGFTFSIKGANKKLFQVYYYNPLFYLMVIYFFFFDIIQKLKR